MLYLWSNDLIYCVCARIGVDFCGECVDELRNTYLSLGTHFFRIYVLVDCVFMISERNLGPARWPSFTLKKVPGPVWSSYLEPIPSEL